MALTWTPPGKQKIKKSSERGGERWKKLRWLAQDREHNCFFQAYLQFYIKYRSIH